MIFIVKGADYSANNIGHIDIKRELNQFTLDAIVASGNESMSTAQKIALDNFFESVGAFGTRSEVWSKLDRVYIPFLCNSLDKAVLNYKTNLVDRSLSAERYKMRNKGITGLSASPATYTESAIVDNVAINTRDLTILGMMMESDASLTGEASLAAYNGNSGSNRWFSNFQKSGAGDCNCVLQGISPSGNVNYSVAINEYPVSHKLMGISVRSSSDRVYVQKDALRSNTTESSFLAACGVDTPSKSLSLFSSSTGKALSSNAPSIGMMILGKSLTDEELITLKSASESLVEFFK